MVVALLRPNKNSSKLPTTAEVFKGTAVDCRSLNQTKRRMTNETKID